MIALGINGLSRGELQLGALATARGESIIPLHLDPVARSHAVATWLEGWLGADCHLASPDDWFYAAQQSGQYSYPPTSETWIWSLPPAAALIALKQLGNACLKRHGVLRGVVLVPFLYQPEWFQHFRRVVDMYFFIPARATPFWPASMHEPLTVGLYLPLLQHRPWDWKHVSFVVPFCLSLSAMYKSGEASGGNILHEFWEASGWVAHMPAGLVCSLLQGTSWRRFLNILRER